MTIAHTDGAANDALDALYDQYNSGKLRILDGSVPAGPGAAQTGTLLAEIDVPNPAFAAASGGSKAKAGTWADVGLAAGVATYYRLVQAADDGAADENDIREQGTVGEAGSGADLILSNTDIAVDQPVSVTTFTRTG